MYFASNEEAARKIIFGEAMTLLMRRALVHPVKFAGHTRWSVVDGQYTSGVWGLCAEKAHRLTLTNVAFFWPRVVLSLKKIYSERFENTEERYAFEQLFLLLRMTSQQSHQERYSEGVRLLDAALLAALPPGVEQPCSTIEGLSGAMVRAFESDSALSSFQKGTANLTLLRIPHRELMCGQYSFQSFLRLCAPLTGAGLQKIDYGLLSDCPRLFQLLYLALQRIREDSAGTGFETWGVCWQPGVLLFNIRKAYDSLQQAGDIEAYMDSVSYEEIADHPTLAMSRNTLLVKKFPQFSDVYYKRSLGPNKQRVIKQLTQHSVPDLEPEHYREFSFTEGRLARYAENLSELDSQMSEMFLHRRTSRVEGEAVDKRFPIRPQYVKPVSVTMNACSLGFFTSLCPDVKYVPMTFRIWSTGDAHFISYPYEYAARVQTVHYQRGHVKRDGYFGYPLEWFFNSGELRNHVTYDIDPSNVDEIRRERSAYLKAFHVLCQWIRNPKHEECSELIDEYLMALYADNEGLLHDPTDRVRFLRAKGIAKDKEPVYDKTNRVSRSSDERETRSSRFSDYDHLVLSYVAKHELSQYPFDEYKMEKYEYAKYVCARWMPWRKPMATMQYLHEVPHWFTGQDAKLVDADFMLAHEEFKDSTPPFTHDRPAVSNEKVTQFVCKEHLPQ